MQRNGSTKDTGMSQWSARKPAILAIVAAITLVIILPPVLPHIDRTSIVYLVILHAVSVIIAIFLSVIAVIAYRRVGGTKVLLMSSGFVMLGIFEVFYFVDATEIVSALEIPLLNIELPHLILFAVLVLFGVGVLRGEK